MSWAEAFVAPAKSSNQIASKAIMLRFILLAIGISPFVLILIQKLGDALLIPPFSKGEFVSLIRILLTDAPKPRSLSFVGLILSSLGLFVIRFFVVFDREDSQNTTKIYKEMIIAKQFLLLSVRYCRKYIQEDVCNQNRM
jgi:hypothetical protein